MRFITFKHIIIDFDEINYIKFVQHAMVGDTEILFGFENGKEVRCEGNEEDFKAIEETLAHAI